MIPPEKTQNERSGPLDKLQLRWGKALFTTFIGLNCLVTIQPVAHGAPADSATKYTADWESLNSRPTPAWFTDAKFGIFIHWGVYSVPAWSVTAQHSGSYSEWYWWRIMETNKNGSVSAYRKFHDLNYGPDFSYMDFAPHFRAELFDPEFWAKTFADSGARYVVLTSKHHDGFALWPNEDANRSWGRPWNSVDIGPKRDLLGDLTTAVRRQGLKMGIYYSLYEWFNPLWLKDQKQYATEHMHPQFKDVVTRYSPSIIFSDGEWDISSSDWRSPELLAWLFNESPSRHDVVINDRWGKKERHQNGGYFTTEYGAGLPDASHPWEENRGMGYSFGYSRTEQLKDYRTGKELIWMFTDLVSRGGNLLLDIGPDADGTIPVIMQDRLAQMGEWLKVNGEAIYGTTPWKKTCQWSEGTQPEPVTKRDQAKYDIMTLAAMKPENGQARKQAFLTAKGDTLYAILPNWPGKTFTLKDVKTGKGTAIQMLGVPGNLNFSSRKGNLIINIPQLTIDQLPCQHAWTLKITHVAATKE
ncbi:MAG TPA: alpha-L-fucosidase [Verrucomicrobiae bacterium]|nr:alpha-L-fucosidase [Verrucomicrobiae bacterium]